MNGTMTWVGLDVHASSTHAAAIDSLSGELRRARFGRSAQSEVGSQLTLTRQSARASATPAPDERCHRRFAKRPPGGRRRTRQAGDCNRGNSGWRVSFHSPACHESRSAQESKYRRRDKFLQSSNNRSVACRRQSSQLLSISTAQQFRRKGFSLLAHIRRSREGQRRYLGVRSRPPRANGPGFWTINW